VTNSKLLKIGLVGTVISALCCFTPLLVVSLGAIGLTAMVGWLDYLLLPALFVFVTITVYALIRTKNLAKHE